jgi:hypothetical protein
MHLIIPGLHCISLSWDRHGAAGLYPTNQITHKN